MFYLLIVFRPEYYFTYSNFFANNLSSSDGKSVSALSPTVEIFRTIDTNIWPVGMMG